jgi:epoxyqueuosine reductase QueG
VPRKQARWLRRNALLAAGNVGTRGLADSVVDYAQGDDEMLRETAEWALARITERG